MAYMAVNLGDTLASELGCLSVASPRMVLTFHQVSAAFLCQFFQASIRFATGCSWNGWWPKPVGNSCELRRRCNYWTRFVASRSSRLRCVWILWIVDRFYFGCHHSVATIFISLLFQQRCQFFFCRCHNVDCLAADRGRPIDGSTSLRTCGYLLSTSPRQLACRETAGRFVLLHLLVPYKSVRYPIQLSSCHYRRCLHLSRTVRCSQLCCQGASQRKHHGHCYCTADVPFKSASTPSSPNPSEGCDG